MGEWVRDDSGHSPERPENVGWGNLMGFVQPESIFLEQEAQEHRASTLNKWDWEGKAEMKKFQRGGREEYRRQNM